MSTETLLRRPQRYYFSIAKTLSKRLCTCYCHGWRNMVCQKSGKSSWTGGTTQIGFDSSRNKWTFGSGSLLCQEFRRRREETARKRRRIETSLLIVRFMLRVMTYVVSHKQSLKFWNWIDVVRFVSHKVQSDKGFVIQTNKQTNKQSYLKLSLLLFLQIASL